MALRPQIDTAKYIIVNQKFKDLKVKSEKCYSDKGKARWYTREYDKFGRIVAVYNQSFYGKRYQYIENSDTLTKIEYKSEKQVLTGINKIEKFIYNKSGKIITYITTFKYIDYRVPDINEDSSVKVEIDKLYYDSHQRILKIKHFSKSFSNQVLQLSLAMSIDSMQQVSSDTFKYDIRQRTAISAPTDSSRTLLLFAQTKYDDKDRVINETTVCTPLGYNESDTVEEKYIFERNKVTCSKTEYGYPRTLPFVTIRTEYYSKLGLRIKLTSLSVSLKKLDTHFFEYEFYS